MIEVYDSIRCKSLQLPQ